MEKEVSPLYYILDGKKPVPEPDLFKWAKWFKETDRQVKLTTFGDITISTVFLGLDHGWHLGEESRPLFFETMIFRGKHDGYCKRYTTWEEAELGHEEAVQLVKEDMI